MTGSLPFGIKLVRSLGAPIISPETHPSIGSNINGPSLIKVPDWVMTRFGGYYLYFAAHRGKYIRLAYSDAVTGPWRVHPAGVLNLPQTPFTDHIASPDVHILPEYGELRMYYHGVVSGGRQGTAVARSRDGITFVSGDEIIGDPYFRAFRWRNHFYAIAKPGVVFRSSDGMSRFVRGHSVLEPSARHAAVVVHDDRLIVLYSRIGDRPERLLAATIDLKADWLDWRASRAVTVLRAEYCYEGGELPVQASKLGEAQSRVNQLRDPAIFVDGGRMWVIYALAGESGLGLAELQHEPGS